MESYIIKKPKKKYRKKKRKTSLMTMEVGSSAVNVYPNERNKVLDQYYFKFPPNFFWINGFPILGFEAEIFTLNLFPIIYSTTSTQLATFNIYTTLNKNVICCWCFYLPYQGWHKLLTTEDFSYAKRTNWKTEQVISKFPWNNKKWLSFLKTSA